MQRLYKFLPHFIVFILFVIISLAYFSPVLQGKKIFQSDIVQYTGMAKQQNDFRKSTGEETYWTNAAFGGMPTYQLGAKYPHNYIKKLDLTLRFLPRPADYLFLYFIGMYILFLVLKLDYKLAFVGALAFGFSTYLIIILGVGHNAKAHAIAYMPLVLSGILLALKGNYLKGFILTTIAMALELVANHFQMTYYLLLLVLVIGFVYLIDSYNKKTMPSFFKGVGVLVVAVVFAIGLNATNILATKEYADTSTRGKSELTINPDGSSKEANKGLDYDYITEYSYGKLESFNLFIPRFKGGTRNEEVKESELRNFLQESVNKGLDANDANYLMQISSMYWGDQPIVAAPAYIGALFIFLFVLALFLVKGKFRNWLVAATILSILLSWGKNLSFLTDFFIDYVPMYNKFRAVSSIQVIAELAVPLLGILGFKELLNKGISKEVKLKALKKTTIIVGGLALIFTVGGTGLYSFETPVDLQIDAQISGYLDAIVADRQALFFGDSLRSLIIVSLFAGMIYLYLNKKIKSTILIISFGVIVLFDLGNVDKRYVNNDSFTSARKVNKPFKASAIDKEILKDKSYYRVADLTKNIMADGSTSYFHKSIGGYHAAKPRRYQELYDFHIAKNNLEVLNMLNTKYLITSDESGKKVVQLNEFANGNAWFVSKLKVLDSANEEMKALDSIRTKGEAVISSKNISSDFVTNYKIDSLAFIKLIAYKANELSYEFSASSNQYAVFSEIYYKDGWNAYIDGELVSYYNVNYVLRGMEIPKGKHLVEFKFEPSVIDKGNTITLISYFLLLIIPVGWFFIERRKKN